MFEKYQRDMIKVIICFCFQSNNLCVLIMIWFEIYENKIKHIFLLKNYLLVIVFGAY